MSRKSRKLRGIALAGGGPLGGVYEIGALIALQEALIGVDLADLDVYVGVSSGAFIAAGLANGIAPSEMHAMFILDKSHHDPFEPETLLKPAFAEFARRLGQAPALLTSAARAYLHSGSGLVASFLRLTRALPTGLFDNEPIAAYMRRLFSQAGRSDDFRKLKHRLYILAADLDSGAAATFGAPGFDDAPISEAVKASSALPGLYPPAHIHGRDYIDGAVKKTINASVALKAGVKLLICVNPIVPFNADVAAKRSGGKPLRLADSGLIGVLSQSFRALIHSRMQVGMERYASEYPDADVLLFEPAVDDEVMFFSNIFSYGDRREACEHAYLHTREQLRARAAELEFVLARHGARLDRAALADTGRRLPSSVAIAPGRHLWKSRAPLDDALSQLERAWTKARDQRRPGGVEPNAAETAAANAQTHSRHGARAVQQVRRTFGGDHGDRLRDGHQPG